MINDPFRERGSINRGLTWIGAASLVLTVHAAVIVALAHRPDTATAAIGGEPDMEIDLEPVEGEKAPDDTIADTSGAPATASAAAAEAAAAPETAATDPVAATPPSEPPKVEPISQSPSEPAKPEPIPPPPEPPKVEPVSPPPEPPRVAPAPPNPIRPLSHASTASAAADAAEESAPAVQKLSAGREAAWRGLLVAHLNRFRRFPRGLGNGTTRIGFTIDAMGAVTATEVVSGSGDAALDAAARSLVVRASPFPPPPAGVSSRSLSFVVPIHFDGRRP